MNKHIKHSKKAYVLVVTIVICLFLSITALTIYSVVYRYTTSITNNIDDLRDIVYDNGSNLENIENGD